MTDGNLVFRVAREGALRHLRDGIYRNDEPSVCYLLDSEQGGLNCNLGDHLRAVEDLLTHGRWVDDLTADDSDHDERLYRYFALVAWAVEPCLEDLGEVLRSVGATAPSGLSERSKNLKGWINRVFKHRMSPVGKTGVSVHACLHHGPFYFDDLPGSEVDECALTLDNWRTAGHEPCSALLPRLEIFVSALTAELQRAVEISESVEAGAVT